MLAFVVVLALATGAMPEPPKQVRYPVKRGEVIFDHAAHLARREKCRTCHGDRAATKLGLDKTRAHNLCLGCHWGKKQGPKTCTGCHGDE